MHGVDAAREGAARSPELANDAPSSSFGTLGDVIDPRGGANEGGVAAVDNVEEVLKGTTS